MNTKPPRFDVKNIIVLNFDEDALDKICFRESLLISHCRNVDNNRKCVPFVEKCSEVCPNEQCDDDISDPDDINNELFHPKPTSIQAKQGKEVLCIYAGNIALFIIFFIIFNNNR